ncbi:biotin transporter BioY [[Clostridium] polysaccharolyticum]|uniref:Biotin transporter n=1 Tax=[Clostridium] polysaccharolyticum TaxID=29364 RepID=A0A1H9YRH3_9FIRM|nr:biotin transporter BioY [[Clostridium] polysaccharolyticum]SES71732.1 biotin transport system substrate-specific component [[Clostridium] polysaccharolyticum]
MEKVIVNSKRKSSTYEMAGIALMAALMCILGPMSIPVGAVPITLTNLVVYLAVYLLGTKKGTTSYGIYLVLGIFGLPVFSGYSGGVAKLAGPTGGYLIGFIFMALVTGTVIKLACYHVVWSVMGMVAATFIAYAFGTGWFVVQAQCKVAYALGVCVFPFLLGDFIKIVSAAFLGPVIRRQLAKANLL